MAKAWRKRSLALPKQPEACMTCAAGCALGCIEASDRARDAQQVGRPLLPLRGQLPALWPLQGPPLTESLGEIKGMADGGGSRCACSAEQERFDSGEPSSAGMLRIHRCTALTWVVNWHSIHREAAFGPSAGRAGQERHFRRPLRSAHTSFVLSRLGQQSKATARLHKRLLGN